MNTMYIGPQKCIRKKGEIGFSLSYSLVHKCVYISIAIRYASQQYESTSVLIIIIMSCKILFDTINLVYLLLFRCKGGWRGEEVGCSSLMFSKSVSRMLNFYK